MSSLASTENPRIILSSANGFKFEYFKEFDHVTNDSQYLLTGGYVTR